MSERDRQPGLAAPDPGAVAVVTGASSGIGTALATALARRGHPLLLVARREDRLRELADRLTAAHGVAAEVRVCDLTDRADRAALGAELAARRVGLLCANAGFATCGPLADADPDRERTEVELNVVATHELVLAVLPGMLARRSGALLLTGSTAGLQPVPTVATYAASKAFINTFAESLHVELRGTGVGCTLLAPGPTRTEFTGVAAVTHIEKHRWMAWADPDRVAADAVAGLERGARVVVPGVLGKAQAVVGRCTPRAALFPILRVAILPALRRPVRRLDRALPPRLERPLAGRLSGRPDQDPPVTPHR